jgi:hypothetical protein
MTIPTKNKEGFIYILISPNTKYIKIGGTEYPPLKRIKEINGTEPYKSLGPWTLGDFRQVTDWRKVEYDLHYIFKDKLATDIKGQKELFSAALHDVSVNLADIEPAEIVGRPKVDRMFQDKQFYEYLVALYNFSGLLNWLDIQGAWTFVLFPRTNGGRYFTINIGPHEVAFSTLKRETVDICHMVFMDKLILDFEPVVFWVKSHKGEVKEGVYDRALPRSVSVFFEGGFDAAVEFMALEGIRRAIIAYWTESLVILKERGILSPYARYHNYNAIAELNNRVRHSFRR